jgi:hypothetical protein
MRIVDVHPEQVRPSRLRGEPSRRAIDYYRRSALAGFGCASTGGRHFVVVQRESLIQSEAFLQNRRAYERAVSHPCACKIDASVG